MDKTFKQHLQERLESLEKKMLEIQFNQKELGHSDYRQRKINEIYDAILFHKSLLNPKAEEKRTVEDISQRKKEQEKIIGRTFISREKKKMMFATLQDLAEERAIRRPSPEDATVRDCLNCGKEFVSRNKFNRICDACKTAESWSSGGDELCHAKFYFEE